jgi:hypothetical protein
MPNSVARLSPRDSAKLEAALAEHKEKSHD